MTISPVAVQRDEVQRDLWTRTAAVAGRLNRAHAEAVDIAAELIEGGHWGDGGFTSPEHYFVVRAGLSPAHARDLVAVARRRTELSVMGASVAVGALSLDQAAVMAHHVPVSHQRSVGELAPHMTVPQLRRAVSRHAFTDPGTPSDAGATSDTVELDPAGVDSVPDTLREQSPAERRACAIPELSMHYDRDGRFQLRYSAPAPVGALVEQALKEAKDALFTAQSGSGSTSASGAGGAMHPASVIGAGVIDAAAGTSRDGALRDPSDPSGRPTYADALAEIAHRALSSVASTGRASRYRVYLHLSTDGAWVGGGGAIPRRLIERFLTDGVLQPVWETNGRPVSVGRAMRILPARSRRLIQDRDRGCRFPGCTATRFVEIHHLQEWAEGGQTDDTNQISLCPFHHDAIDRGDYRICGDPTRPDGLEVTNRHGLRIRPPTPTELAEPPCAATPSVDSPDGNRPGPEPLGTGEHRAYQPPTGERARWADIEIPPDRDLPPPRFQLRAVSTT